MRGSLPSLSLSPLLGGDRFSGRFSTDAGTLRRIKDQGKWGEAEPLFRKAMEDSRRTLGDTHPSTLISINNLGLLLKAQGKLDEAEPLFVEALQGRRRTLGDTHPGALASINNLAGLLQDQGKLKETNRQRQRQRQRQIDR